jgi:hypothetical protein
MTKRFENAILLFVFEIIKVKEEDLIEKKLSIVHFQNICQEHRPSFRNKNSDMFLKKFGGKFC